MNSKEFVKALKNICEEKSISEDVIFEGMTTALQKAYTKETGLPNIRIEINKDTGEIKGYSYQKVVTEYTDGCTNTSINVYEWFVIYYYS